jgi:tRNA modification GTPase
LSHIEAYIDFSEDENIEEGVMQQSLTQVSQICIECFLESNLKTILTQLLAVQIASLQHEISMYLASGRQGERVRNGLSVTITGAPNVGKSR